MIQIPCEIKKIATMEDGSIQIKLSTREMSPEEMAIIFSLKKNETEYEVIFKEV